MIATARFGPAHARMRRLHFVPRAALPLGAACAVARAFEAAFREMFGACEIAVGEPAALTPDAWAALARDAVLFVRRARAGDAVLVLAPADARRLALHAFGEPCGPVGAERACTALERRALATIAQRCSVALQPLGEAATPLRLVAAEAAPACDAYVDLRFRAPVAMTVGVAITRGVPDAAPAPTIAEDVLQDVALHARAVFAEGTLDAADFVGLRPGDIVKLETKVGAPASLNCGPRRLATGVAGVVASRTAFLVTDVAAGVPG